MGYSECRSGPSRTRPSRVNRAVASSLARNRHCLPHPGMSKIFRFAAMTVNGCPKIAAWRRARSARWVRAPRRGLVAYEQAISRSGSGGPLGSCSPATTLLNSAGVSVRRSPQIRPGWCSSLCAATVSTSGSAGTPRALSTMAASLVSPTTQPPGSAATPALAISLPSELSALTHGGRSAHPPDGVRTPRGGRVPGDAVFAGVSGDAVFAGVSGDAVIPVAAWPVHRTRIGPLTVLSRPLASRTVNVAMRQCAASLPVFREPRCCRVAVTCRF